jgi:hypothetical protein
MPIDDLLEEMLSSIPSCELIPETSFWIETVAEFARIRQCSKSEYYKIWYVEGGSVTCPFG